MSITSLQANQAGPIIQGLIHKNEQNSGGGSFADPARVLGQKPVTAADSFEPGEVKNDEAQKIAQIRRFAAQQQAVSFAPPQQANPSGATGLISNDGDGDSGALPDVDGDTLAPPQQTPPSAGADTTAGGVTDVNLNEPGPTLPGPIGDTLAPPQQTPPSAGADTTAGGVTDVNLNEPGPTLPGPIGDTLAPSNQVFTSDDRDRLLSLFGLSKGDKRFDSSLDLNHDGTINGADLANLLVNFSNSTKSSDTPNASQSPDRLLQGILKAFGSQIGKKDSNSVFDLNGDGVINGADIAQALVGESQPTLSTTPPGLDTPSTTPTLKALLSAFGSVAGDSAFSRPLDFTSDGVINGADLAQFLTQQLKVNS